MATDNEAATIEKEIRETQNEMSSTIDRIGEQLNAKNLVNAVFDRVGNGDVDTRILINGAKRNPVALGLIAVGAIWLLSGKEAKMPSLPSKLMKPRGGRWPGGRAHRDYVAHMAEIERRPDEDAEAYQRRRDEARSNFFMIERNHDEDEHGFRQRLDSMAESYREKRRNWAESSDQFRDATKERLTRATDKTRDMYGSNPMIGGFIAAAIGAAIGSTLPASRPEREKLGSLGEKARNMVSEQARKASDQLLEKKNDIFQGAQEALKPKSDVPMSGQPEPSQSANTGFV